MVVLDDVAPVRHSTTPALRYAQSVAKRGLKRARQREQAPSSSSPGKAAHRTRAFWLGALATAALLIPVAIVAVVITANRDDDSPANAATTSDSIQSRAEKLRRESRERDKQQVQELTRRMATTLGDLGPAMRGLARTVPPEQKRIGPLASAPAVEKWSRTVRDSAGYFEDPPSGETDTNVARMGFAAAIAQLDSAIDTYRIALTDSAHRRELLERVRTERDLAVQTWFIGGTELDAVNHKYGYGHHHIYLAPEGNGAPGDLQTG
jgi:hypothetical protein